MLLGPKTTISKAQRKSNLCTINIVDKACTYEHMSYVQRGEEVLQELSFAFVPSEIRSNRTQALRKPRKRRT